MSVDYTAVIARGFLIAECPYREFPDEFIEEWVIDFNCYVEHDSYLIGYYIDSGWEPGTAYEMNECLDNKSQDNLLIEACRKANIPIGEIKTYFGVRVS